MAWNTSAQADFALRNASKRNVTLTSIRSSCGCAVLLEEMRGPTVLAPGQQLRIPVRFQSGRRAGRHNAIVTCESADGEIARALIGADVECSWRLSADMLVFPNLTAAAASPWAQTIQFLSRGPNLTAVRSSTEWLDCSARPGAGGAEIYVSVFADRLLPGENLGRVVIRTSDPNVPDGTVVVRARRANAENALQPARNVSVYPQGEPE